MQDFYRHFFENSPIAFWRTAIEDGRFLLANLACAKMLGHDSVESLLKDKSIHYYVNGDRQHILDHIKTQGEVNHYDTELVLGNGKHIWVSITAKVYPAEGYIEGLLYDVTPMKKLEEKVNIELKALIELQKGMKEKIQAMSVSLPDHNTSMNK